MKNDSDGLWSRIRTNRFLAILVLMLLGFGVLTGVIDYRLREDSSQDQVYKQMVADLRAASYQLTSLSRDATAGNKQAFEKLERVVADMDQTWSKIQSTDGQTRAVLSEEISTYDSAWKKIKDNAGVITDNQDSIILMHDVATTLNEALPELQQEHDTIVEILLENGAPAEQISVAQRQSWFAERIGRNVDKMLRGGLDATRAADEFNRDASRFGNVLEAMKKGDVAMGMAKVTDPDAVESLDQITRLFAFVSGSVSDIYEKSPDLFSARQAANAIIDGSPFLLKRLGDLSDGINNLPGERKVNSNFLIAAIAGAVLCLIAIVWVLNLATKRRLQEQAETNERNQSAILRLLDELADLADGDLTTTATVTEDFTGAIADSINYTIDQLRVLVSRINDTSANVSAASEETKQTALHLARASEHQAQEIAGASAAVNEMAVTIDQVSANAAESARVAERAVSIAFNGAKVVQNTINGMDTIREQIQDTAKRIKRLGESSQEIGDIVSLINDIADQTNILALNAAIQASMAGDAGRGFAVVADEVQRLAERSATATKQIEALVKTIQSDTTAAVNSMEQTTAEVVRGARLAQDAGVALEEIESVSASLAELIQNISNAARQQSTSAGHISNTMNVIQEFTSQTSAGTSATAEAIGRLAQMAIELHQSVAGFKLPEEMANEMQSLAAAMPSANAAISHDLSELSLESDEHNQLDETGDSYTADEGQNDSAEPRV